MRRYGLRDDQWEQIKDLLPSREGHVVAFILSLKKERKHHRSNGSTSLIAPDANGRHALHFLGAGQGRRVIRHDGRETAAGPGTESTLNLAEIV